MATRSPAGEATLQAFRGLHLPGIVQNRHLLAPDGRLQSVAGELSALMLKSGLLPAADPLTGLCTDAYLPEGGARDPPPLSVPRRFARTGPPPSGCHCRHPVSGRFRPISRSPKCGSNGNRWPIT